MYKIAEHTIGQHTYSLFTGCMEHWEEGVERL